jgi:hypothetical protein
LGYQVTEFQDTPNPNALKCVLDRPLSNQPFPSGHLRSYQTAAAAEGDPLAADLFTIPGVAGVLINPGWVTVSKAPDAQWKNVKAGVKKVLGAAE